MKDVGATFKRAISLLSTLRSSYHIRNAVQYPLSSHALVSSGSEAPSDERYDTCKKDTKLVLEFTFFLSMRVSISVQGIDIAGNGHTFIDFNWHDF